MKSAILFHQAQELILLREQKRILRILNDRAVAYYPVFPLWCFCDDPVCARELEKLKRAIRSVTLHTPCVKENALIFPVAIELCGQAAAEASVVFAVQASPQCAAPERLPVAELFPIRCKTFRLAAVRQNGAAYEAFSPVWAMSRF